MSQKNVYTVEMIISLPDGYEMDDATLEIFISDKLSELNVEEIYASEGENLYNEES